jgi:hypothetical protein
MQNKELMPFFCAVISVVVILICMVLYHPQISAIHQTEYDSPMGEIYGENQFGQTFFNNGNDMDRIDILLATYARNNSGNITFHLREKNGKFDLRTIIIDVEKVPDNQYYSFTFLPIENSKNKFYEFFLESSSASSGNAITIWYHSTNSYDSGNATINGTDISGDMAFQVFNKCNVFQSISDSFWRFSMDLKFFVGYVFIVLFVLSILLLYNMPRK